MQVPREVWALKRALDDLLSAHEEFDCATFYGTASEMHGAQSKVDAARRRSKLAASRFEGAMREFASLGELLEGPDDVADLEKRTRL